MAGFKTRTGVGYSVPVITYRCVLYLLLHYAHTPRGVAHLLSDLSELITAATSHTLGST